MVYDKRRRDLSDGAAGIRPAKRAQVFSVAAKEWLDLKRPKWSPKMGEIGDYSLRHLMPIFGGNLVSTIDAGDIGRYQQMRLAEGASGRTCNIEVGILRQVLKHHGQWHRILTSPAWKTVGMLEERRDAGRALTPTEERILLLECEESASRRLSPFVLLLLETGARYSTIRNLTWGQVDFPGRR